MFKIKRLTIAQYERALVWKNKAFAGVLEPGVHWIYDPFMRVVVQTYDLTVPEFEHPRVDFLISEARAAVDRRAGRGGVIGQGRVGDEHVGAGRRRVGHGVQPGLPVTVRLTRTRVTTIVGPRAAALGVAAVSVEAAEALPEVSTATTT